MKIISLLSLALVPLFAAAAEPAAAPDPAAPRQQLLALRADKNRTATVTLRENPTTGFEWMAKYNPELCKVEISRRVGDSGLCGAPGQAIVTVTLLTDAPADLTLEYRRPWEKDTPPARVLHYAVLPEAMPSAVR